MYLALSYQQIFTSTSRCHQPNQPSFPHPTPRRRKRTSNKTPSSDGVGFFGSFGVINCVSFDGYPIQKKKTPPGFCLEQIIVPTSLGFSWFETPSLQFFQCSKMSCLLHRNLSFPKRGCTCATPPTDRIWDTAFQPREPRKKKRFRILSMNHPGCFNRDLY